MIPLAKSLSMAALLICMPQEEKENPSFKHWSRWKAGAWVKFKMDTEFLPGNKIETELTTKVLEIGAETIVLEHSAKVKRDGQLMDLSTEKAEIKPKDSRFPEIGKEGDEEIELSGRKIKCHWIQTKTQDTSKGKVTSKFWFSEEIPGGLVKSETRGEDGKLPRMNMQAVEWGEK